ncbi:hypothetical protein VKS41_009015 [Umbelopsis sp. WA50703]
MFKSHTDMYKEGEVPSYGDFMQEIPKARRDIISVPETALAGKDGPSQDVQRHNTLDFSSSIDNDDTMPHFPQHILDEIYTDLEQ